MASVFFGNSPSRQYFGVGGWRLSHGRGQFGKGASLQKGWRPRNHTQKPRDEMFETNPFKILQINLIQGSANSGLQTAEPSYRLCIATVAACSCTRFFDASLCPTLFADDALLTAAAETPAPHDAMHRRADIGLLLLVSFRISYFETPPPTKTVTNLQWHQNLEAQQRYFLYCVILVETVPQKFFYACFVNGVLHSYRARCCAMRHRRDVPV